MLHIAKLPPREQGFQAGHTLSWIFPAGTVAEGVGTAAKTSLAKAVNTIGLEESVSRLTELFATKFRYETAVAEGTQLQRGLLEQAEKTAVAEKISAKSARQAVKESTMLQETEKATKGGVSLIEAMISEVKTISENDLPHIFRNRTGHLIENTAANRQLLINMASNSKIFLGQCERGSLWFAERR